MKHDIRLNIQHISKEFKNYTALRDINFVLHTGEIVGFLGPSGTGKTTTIKIVTGQLKQSGGTAEILGKDTRNINSAIYKQIGIVSDNSGVYEKMTVYQNISYFAQFLDVPRSYVDELLKRVYLYEHKKKRANNLSRGQLQRLVLIRAILHKPKILFLDEPTSGLDPSTTLEVHKLLLELKQDGMAIFLTTHNMEEATKLCDQVALIHNGEVVEFGTPTELSLKYADDKTYSVLLKDNTMHLLKHNKAEIEQISQWLLEDKIATIHSSEPSLEQVFLTVTGKELS